MSRERVTAVNITNHMYRGLAGEGMLSHCGSVIQDSKNVLASLYIILTLNYILQENIGVGGVLGLLWFQRK